MKTPRATDKPPADLNFEIGTIENPPGVSTEAIKKGIRKARPVLGHGPTEGDEKGGAP